MRTRFSVLMILFFLAIATAIAPAAEGHGGGSAVISARGSFLLSPAGALNDTFHAFLSDIGLPIGAGDVLRFSWRSNNGSGPQIYFEIHAHPATAGYVQYYNTTARSANGTWSVPGQEPYMVYWQNPNPDLANVSYEFADIPPPIDLWIAVLVSLTPAMMVPAVIVVAWWRARRKKRRTRPPRELSS